MTTPAHTLHTISNGEAAIRINTPALHAAAGCGCYGSHRNGNEYTMTAHSYGDVLTLKEIGANLRAAFPAARIKVTTRRVIIRPPAAMQADWEALGARWQAQASEGWAHFDMLNSTQNAIEYRRHQA